MLCGIFVCLILEQCVILRFAPALIFISFRDILYIYGTSLNFDVSCLILYILYFWHFSNRLVIKLQTKKGKFTRKRKLNSRMIKIKKRLYLNIFQKKIMPKYILKSGKEEHHVEHCAEQSYEDFQAKVFALTDIPPKNLKILFKSKMIKENEALLNIPDGSQLIIMGTKVGRELKQTGNVKIETMDIEQPNKIARFGLVNIGNTCYMNSSIQFLRCIPELDQMMKSIKLNNPTSPHQVISHTLANVLKELDKKDVIPQNYVGMFLQIHPEFQPFKSQHDADQFMQKLLDDITQAGGENGEIIRKTFQVEMMNTLKNTEIEEEEVKVTFTTSTKIGCSLGGNQKDTKVGTLLQGIKLGLQTNLQKISPVDNANHIYESVNKFNSLPPHLIVQMVRFFWKEVNEPDSAFNKPLATKICRAVDFGNKLDLFDFCTPELQEKLQKGRQAYEINKKRDEQIFKEEYESYKNDLKDTNRPETRIMEEFKEKWANKQKRLTEGLETGIYELHAVVTHLGNSVESGHYMAWVKESEDEWTKYDDDTVYQQPEAKVLQLRGGQPNLEIAYLLMFRKVYTRPLE